jgi:hypothetical protein
MKVENEPRWVHYRTTYSYQGVWSTEALPLPHHDDDDLSRRRVFFRVPT